MLDNPSGDNHNETRPGKSHQKRFCGIPLLLARPMLEFDLPILMQSLGVSRLFWTHLKDCKSARDAFSAALHVRHDIQPRPLVMSSTFNGTRNCDRGSSPGYQSTFQSPPMKKGLCANQQSNYTSVMIEGTVVGLDSADLLRFYYYLRLTRGLEDRVIKLYRQGRILGGCYVGTGEEAISVGSACALEPDDVIAPSHRDLGAHLVKGVTPNEYMAQYLGRLTGLTRGKDGTIHFGDLRRRIIGFISPMADGIPVATGVALAFKTRREPHIAVSYFGDGASSRGDFHEGLNLAAVLRLPILFICHNNQYAYSVPVSRQMAVPHVADRAKAYGLPTRIIDGNDILAVYQTTKEAAAQARGGGGPIFIECKTMRMRGHAEHDDASYVPRELLEEWRGRDPIQKFEHYLREREVPEDQLRAIEARVVKEVEEALDFAEKSPLPDGPEALEGVFAP